MAEWRPISELFDFTKGTLQSSKAKPGEFPFITAAEEWKTNESYTHDCEALIFAMAASGSLGRTHYIKGKFISSDLCFILTPKKGIKLDLNFYHRLFNYLRQDIVKRLATGTSKLAINQTSFGAYKLPYFDYPHQLMFHKKMETLLGINTDFSRENEIQGIYLKRLRQQLIQDAIEGKLTADWRKKNPTLITGANHASKLLERIKAEKAHLAQYDRFKAEKPLFDTSESEKPFPLPEGWSWCHLQDVAYGFDYGSSTKSKHEGAVPVLRMGNIQNGFIDWEKLVYTDNAEEIETYLLKSDDLLFNRTNSREMVGKTALYNSDRRAIFAGYLVRFHMWKGLNPQYANYVMNSVFHRSWCNQVKADALGQSNINATKLKSFLFSLPPLAEQNALVDLLNKNMAKISELEAQATDRKHFSEMLMKSVLNEAFSAERITAHL